MKKLLLPVLLLISLSSFAQPAGVDSLENLLADKSLKEITRIDVLNELAYLRRSELAVSIVYAREAMALAKRIGYEKGEAAASNAFSFYYWSKMENEKSLQYALSALRIFESLNDKKGLMDTYTLIGLTYLNLKESDKAEKYFNLSLPLSLESKNDEAIGRVYNSFGVVALARNDRKEALKLFLKAHTYLKRAENTPIKVIVLCNIGMMHRLNSDTQKAFPYLFEGLQINMEMLSACHY